MSTFMNYIPKFVDEDMPATSDVQAELDWSQDDMLDQATSFILQNNQLDDLTSIISCKQSNSLLSESMWEKFDLLDYVLDDSQLDPLDKEDPLPAQETVRLSSSLESNPSPISEMRHHDCMWAGLCRHEEHGDADSLVTPPCSPTFDIRAPSPVAAPRKVLAASTMVTSTPSSLRPTNSRSLLVPRKELKRPDSKLAVSGKTFMEFEHRPETPVSDFDDSIHSMRNVCYNEEDSETDSIQSSSETEEECVDTVDNCDSASRYLNHGPSYITDHTYGRPAFRQPTPDTNDYGLCTPSDSEEEIDVVTLQHEMILPEATLIEDDLQLCPPTKRAKLTPTKRSARQSARAARASSLAGKRHSQSQDFQEELHNSLAAMAAEAAKEVVPPLRLRLQQAGAKRRKSAPVSSVSSSSGSSSDSSSDDTPTPKRGPKRSRLSKKIAAAARKRSAASSARSSSDSEDRSGKRTMHNTMERQRRVDLRNAFESLRMFIPELLNSEKAPKVTILREASVYCMALQEEEASHERQKKHLMKKQAALRQRLADARRSVASSRR